MAAAICRRMRILLATALFAAACVSPTAPPDDQQLDVHSGGKADGQSCDFANESAQTYLGHFLYSKTDDGWYHTAFTFDGAPLPNGDTASITAYLLADNRAVVEYKEDHRIDSESSDVLNQTVVVTHYTVDDTTRALTIAGIGGGAPITVTRDGGGCVAGYTFTYSDDIRTAGLAGATAILDAGISSGVLVDPDHLDQAPEGARDYFQEQVADGTVVVIHK
jgi:hypothetical protein